MTALGIVCTRRRRRTRAADDELGARSLAMYRRYVQRPLTVMLDLACAGTGGAGPGSSGTRPAGRSRCGRPKNDVGLGVGEGALGDDALGPARSCRAAGSPSGPGRGSRATVPAQLRADPGEHLGRRAIRIGRCRAVVAAACNIDVFFGAVSLRAGAGSEGQQTTFLPHRQARPRRRATRAPPARWRSLQVATPTPVTVAMPSRTS